jgi:hypothetical protein
VAAADISDRLPGAHLRADRDQIRARVAVVDVPALIRAAFDPQHGRPGAETFKALAHDRARGDGELDEVRAALVGRAPEVYALVERPPAAGRDVESGYSGNTQPLAPIGYGLVANTVAGAEGPATGAPLPSPEGFELGAGEGSEPGAGVPPISLAAAVGAATRAVASITTGMTSNKMTVRAGGRTDRRICLSFVGRRG